MRRTLSTMALLGILGFASAPARAHDGWLGVGTGFRVGNVHLSLAFGQPAFSYPRALYYRTVEPFAAHGLRCNSYCYHQGAVYYHHDSCPLVRSHFARLGIDPYSVVAQYAPPIYGRYYPSYSYGYRTPYRYYDRYAYAPRFELRIGNGYRDGYGYRGYSDRSYGHRYDRGHDGYRGNNWGNNWGHDGYRGNQGHRGDSRHHDDHYRPGMGRGSAHHPRR